ncbi:MAG TPA: NAD(P)-dependent oxidoreductase [Tepidisphaeraceae bacterium]|jgi:nucleoside-diphosphate-sugar epimerase|nr:NAD(P)-dependent oxidoreductase [Tepidisphaeraceae bacterium]
MNCSLPNRALITGGSGFFGGLLKRRLLERSVPCVNIDLVKDDDVHPLLTTAQGDICDAALIKSIFAAHRFDAIFHCAALLAHDVKDKKRLWASNVHGAEFIAGAAAAHHVRKVVYISTNCLWGRGFNRPVTEDDPPAPVELYGRSKWEGEKIFQRHAADFQSVILRCPTIIDVGRMGLLAILFQFIEEGRRVWVVGPGDNRYQFIYAGDLIDACLAAAAYAGSATFNVGSDDVKSLREVYDSVIAKARTGARTASLPKQPTLFLMRVMHALKLSPLGPYHYKMIAEDFSFDTTRVKAELNWKPTLTNEQMLDRAYRYYRQHGAALALRDDVSAHRKPADMGIIRLLKWIS